MIRGSTLPPEHETVEVKGRTLHYIRQGSGPPLVLLHGASSSLRDWTFQHVDVLSRNWTVIAFDRPGLGASDPASDPSLSAQGLLMRRALSALGIGRVTLAGHSFGGAVALAWALDAPDSVAGMVLTGAPSHAWPGTAGRLYDLTNTPVIGWAFSEALPWVVAKSTIKERVSSAFEPQAMPNGYIEHTDPRRVTFPPAYRRNAAQVGILKKQLEAMTPQYGNLSMPLQIIHGEADDTVSATIHSIPLAKAAQNADLHLLPGMGHMPHHMAPEVFYQAIDRLHPN